MMMLMDEASTINMKTRNKSSRNEGESVTMGRAATKTRTRRINHRKGFRSVYISVRSQQACRSKQQDRNENHVLDHRNPADRNENCGDAFQQSQDDAADERARRVTQSTQH